MAVIVSCPLYSDMTSFCSFSAVTQTRKGSAVVSGVSASLPQTNLAEDSTIVLLDAMGAVCTDETGAVSRSRGR